MQDPWGNTQTRTCRQTHTNRNVHSESADLVVHQYWVIDWPGQKILREAWLLKHLISQLSRCSKKNTAAGSGLCPFIALGLLGQVAAGHFWGVSVLLKAAALADLLTELG